MENKRAELFKAYEGLSWRVKRLNSIIQNDVEIPMRQLDEWDEIVNNVIKELSTLTVETYHYVRKNMQ